MTISALQKSFETRPSSILRPQCKENMAAAPALIDQVWYGWCYSRHQSVEEDRLSGLQVWHTLGSLDVPTEINKED